MKQVYVSLIALVLLIATAGAPTAKANGFESGRTFSLSVEGFAQDMSRGEDLTGAIVISTFGISPAVRTRVDYQIYIATPLGDAPVQTGSFFLRGDRTRTFHVSLPIDENAAPGIYSAKFVVTIAGETLSVGHELSVK